MRGVSIEYFKHIQEKSQVTPQSQPDQVNLHNGPPARKIEFVHTKLLLAISIPDTCVNIVVVKNGAERRITDNTLAARSIDPVMRLEDGSAATLETRSAALIDLYILAQ